MVPKTIRIFVIVKAMAILNVNSVLVESLRAFLHYSLRKTIEISVLSSLPRSNFMMGCGFLKLELSYVMVQEMMPEILIMTQTQYGQRETN